MRHLLLVAAIVALFPLLPGCGEEKSSSGSKKGGRSNASAPAEMAETTLPAEIAALLPKDTLAILYVPSAKDLSSKLAPLMAASGESGFDPFEPLRAHPSADFLVDAKLVDETRPYVLALSLQMGGMPTPAPTIALPIRDANDAKQRLTGLGLATGILADGYLVFDNPFSMQPTEPVRGINPPSFPSGIYGVYVDLAAIVQSTRPLLEMGLAAFEGGMLQGEGATDVVMQQTARTTVTHFRSFLDSVSVLRGGFDSIESTYELHATLEMKEGSALAAPTQAGDDLWSVVTSIDPADPVAAVGSYDPVRAYKLLRPFMASSLAMYPSETAAKLETWLDEFLPTMKLMKGASSVSGGLAPGGIRATMFSSVRDEEQFLKQQIDLLHQNPVRGEGVSFADAKPRKSGAIEVYDIVATYDFKKLFGDQYDALGAEEVEQMAAMFYGDELPISMSAHDGIFAMFMGRNASEVDAALAKQGGAHQLEEEFSHAIARVNEAPLSIAGRLDFVAMMRSIARMQVATTGEGQSALNALESVGPITLFSWLRGEGTEFRFGFSFPQSSVNNIPQLKQTIESTRGF